jgi:SAM-dependent methyltransferase
VFCNQLCATREAAREAPTAPLELAFCGACGHAFNAAFDPARVEYGPEYENSLHCSGTFQRYAESLADRLVDRHDLRGKRVVEIGCGRGDFLRLLCARGGNRGYGFDPSYPGDDEGTSVDGVTIFAAPYASGPLAELEADFVCSRHVLEHVAEPVGFLRAVRAACGRPGGTPVFFEVPNALHTLRRGGIWDLIYEHCHYFTPSSLQRAFLEAGFVVDSVEATFGGQFLTLHARALDRPATSRGIGDTGSPSTLRARTEAFAERYRRTVDGWAARLAAFAGRAAPVALWGAGSKGSTFVNVVPGAEAVSTVIDINPRKQGAFVAGSGHPIARPEALREAPPAAVVIMNPIYRGEIAATLAELDLAPELLSADEPIA